jgi:hypothetical protein
VVDESNAPMKSVNVWARSKAGGNQQNAQTNEQGEFTIANLAPGESYVVTAQQNGLKAAVADDVLGGSSGLRMVLARGFEIAGKLTDSGGNGLPQVYLQFSNAEKKSNVGVMTGPDGTFSQAGLEQAEYTVKAYRRIENEDGSQTASWVDIGTVNSPSKDLELRMPN